MTNKKICIIPLRSSSQSVKNKNIVKINLIPLCIYVIRTAISSNLFDNSTTFLQSYCIFAVIQNGKEESKYFTIN